MLENTPKSATRSVKKATFAKSEVTPKSATRSVKKATPAKGRGRKSAQSDVVINLDTDDPFNFDAQAHTLPEPLTNFNVSTIVISTNH